MDLEYKLNCCPLFTKKKIMFASNFVIVIIKKRISCLPIRYVIEPPLQNLGSLCDVCKSFVRLRTELDSTPFYYYIVTSGLDLRC